MPDTKKETSGKIQPTDGRITFGNLIFLYIENNSAFQIEKLMGYDALIIDARDHDFTRLLIKKIRAHYNPEFYLKPVFLLNARPTRDPLINHLHDGIIFSFDQMSEIASVTREIFMLSTQIDYNLPSSFEAQTIKKALNYLFTRNRKTLHPYIDLNSIIGYNYPEISVSFDDAEEAQVLDILAWAEKEGLIWPDFHERIYLCNNCSSGFLSYREVCPHCQSSNATSQDLVHHFPCAYIGPISDFRNSVDSTLSCPKCNKQLRHIGVDYDKPSVVNHCNNCDNNFQDFYVKAKCLACEQDIEVQYLVPRTIYVYKLTKKGRTAAVNGLFTTAQEIDDVFGTIRPEMMKVMLHYESERIKQHSGIKSNIAVIHLENIYDLYNKLGAAARKSLLSELVQLIRENIRSTDYIALESAATVYICLTDTDHAQAEKTCGRIAEVMLTAIRKNFSGFEPGIRYSVSALSTSLPAEQQLQQLAKELFN